MGLCRSAYAYFVFKGIKIYDYFRYIKKGALAQVIWKGTEDRLHSKASYNERSGIQKE